MSETRFVWRYGVWLPERTTRTSRASNRGRARRAAVPALRWRPDLVLGAMRCVGMPNMGCSFVDERLVAETMLQLARARNLRAEQRSNVYKEPCGIDILIL